MLKGECVGEELDSDNKALTSPNVDNFEATSGDFWTRGKFGIIMKVCDFFKIKKISVGRIENQPKVGNFFWELSLILTRILPNTQHLLSSPLERFGIYLEIDFSPLKKVTLGPNV